MYVGMTNHIELQEQIALYALGGLPEEDAARLAEHLDICPSCRAEWSNYQFVAQELLEQVPPQTAPARVATRLQNITTADARRAHPRTAPVSGSPASGPFWRQPLTWQRRLVALGVIALALLLGAVGGYAFGSRTRNETSGEVMRLIAAPDLKYVSLRSSGGSMRDNGYICITADNATGLLWLYNLQPLDRNHVYQVWLSDDTAPYNGGTFRADVEGRAVAVVHAPRPLNQYREIRITIEPAAGSQAPTMPGVIGGKLD